MHGLRFGEGLPFNDICTKDNGGSQRDKDSSANISFNGLKQREMEKEEGSEGLSWYEAQLLIGQPNGGSPKLFFSQIYL